MNSTSLSILIAVLLIGAAIFTTSVIGGARDTNVPPASSVLQDGKQIITISAKGGYSPRSVTAKADMPTELIVDTNNTFDCSSALVIPNIGYRDNLPATGSTTIQIPPQKAGTSLRGLCAMGMYNFVINFE